MAESLGTLEQLTQVLGRVLQPLETRLAAGDVLGLLTIPLSTRASEGRLQAIQNRAAAEALRETVVSVTLTVPLIDSKPPPPTAGD